ncbi:hypothetical protein SD71_02555 [Cohnella kolymensis]|uniref:Uncharacterized protein n=1 Tax=Cohnella kolymensis TaxID=1590652 RepID=A0ABR5A936_9BACL|nr:hypothetical protein [Cohnella kolymensis]KIL37528.1 hypothetical protein SD71_02555 [Cohnella kolymensis]
MAENNNFEPPAGQTARVVADVPGDEAMRSNLQQQIENDGHPGSCGINNSRNNADEPTIAPGLDTDDRLRKPASTQDRQQGDTTEVTNAYFDRTPED